MNRPCDPIAAAAALDLTGFQRLLAGFGPATARDLVRCLSTDLTGVERGLGCGFATTDWQALDAHSHALIALAGLVGAQAMQSAATDLNAVARAQDRVVLAALRSHVPALLVGLIAAVASLEQTP
ncbi:MAG: hypothetical protein Q8O82_06740 [Pseudorhodobacter sp.]|nr:hypothetical protein [Pseudorhodobacter sp.]